MPVHERLMRTDPEYARLRIVSENHHFAFRARRGMNERTGITRIPVVVHVVFKTDAQNISDAQIQSQIDVLNRDFRKKNGGGCDGDDFVTDTPNQADHNFGKPGFPHISCNNGPNGDMFMNCMDYTDDDSMFMFTAGQVERMQACLDGGRSGIGTLVASSPVVTTTSTTDVATMKFREDNPLTLIMNDLGMLKFRDDNPPTMKFREAGNPPAA